MSSQSLVIAVSSSVLFDLTKEHEVFERSGLQGYREHCEQVADVILEKGPAFGLIKKLLGLNELLSETDKNIEVILLSRNSSETGSRVFKSVAHYDLPIYRGIFTDGHSPRRFARSFGVNLFLSANERDVKKSIEDGIPAGLVVGNSTKSENEPLLLSFDFDAVIIDSESESIYQREGLQAFTQHEQENAEVEHSPGPLFSLLKKLSKIREEDVIRSSGNKHERMIRLALVTARSGCAHQRVLTTLSKASISFDIAAFMGGGAKHLVLNEMRPDVFFDDQLSHFNGVDCPTLVHIPFGITNKYFSNIDFD
ncbi:5'-nucleotidase [Vibrio sp. PNB22_3_1]